jgi:long-chain acyl-CoA synthetase
MATPYDARPWLRSYSAAVPTDVDVPSVPVTRLLDDTAAKFPHRRAVIFLGRAITYRKLLRSADKFAHALRSLGVHKGDRVALILPNSPQQVIAFYGTLRRGAVVVANNPMYTAAELHQQLADSGAKVAVVLDHAYETLVAAMRGTALEYVIATSLAEYLPVQKRLALRLPLKKARAARASFTIPLPDDPGLLTFQDVLRWSRGRHHQVPVDPRRDLAALQYTAATTGPQKGAMLTHFNLVANAYQAAAWDPAAQPGRETTLAILPLFHVFGLTLCLTTPVLMGSTIVLVPALDAGLALGAIRKWRPTVFPCVPLIYEQVAAAARARPGRTGSIRVAVSCSTALPRETTDAFREATGVVACQAYGMTEAAPLALANPLASPREGSIGVPLPSTYARIVDESNPRLPVPAGQRGELVIYGPQVFQGYWNQPEMTAQVLLGGWLRTGDIAVMSPDGFFTFIDRKRDVITVDGFNVHPSDVEDVLVAHPAVAECAVAGIMVPKQRELVVAYVVPRDGQQMDTRDLIAFCALRLAQYKVPAMIEIRRELPRDLLGRVLRRALREERGARPGPAGRAALAAPAARQALEQGYPVAGTLFSRRPPDPRA